MTAHDGWEVWLERYIGVSNVGAVVRGIEIDTVPARGEGDRCANSAFAKVIGKTCGVVGTYAWCGLVVTPGIFDKASVTETP